MKDDPFEGLREIARACFKTSRDHGWHEETKIGGYLRALVDTAEEQMKIPPDIIRTLRAFGKQLERDKDVPIMTKLGLICSEVGEAIEAYRNKDLDPAKSYYALKEEDSPATFLCEYTPNNAAIMDAEDYQKMLKAKPEGLGSELADVVIRVFDLAGLVGIDIAAEIERKMKYNESRPYRHGGKLA